MYCSSKIISIVITVYNKAEFIEKTINSVLNQIERPKEVLIINDGSTDSSLDIMNKLELPEYFKVISTENHGVSSARNLGLKMSSANYVYFLDGDDLLEVNALLVFKKAILNNPNFTLYASNRKTYLDTIKIKHVSSREFSFNDYLNYLTQNKNLCWTSAVVVNKLISEKVIFNTEYSHGEDRDYFMRVLKLGNGFWINKTTAKYNKDLFGLSSKPINKNQDLYWKNIINYKEEIKSTFSFRIYKLKYRSSNIINNLKFLKIKNAFSWLI